MIKLKGAERPASARQRRSAQWCADIRHDASCWLLLPKRDKAARRRAHFANPTVRRRVTLPGAAWNAIVLRAWGNSSVESTLQVIHVVLQNRGRARPPGEAVTVRARFVHIYLPCAREERRQKNTKRRQPGCVGRALARAYCKSVHTSAAGTQTESSARRGRGTDGWTRRKHKNIYTLALPTV
eukprot:4299190-Prymnesium_polylepis.1